MFTSCIILTIFVIFNTINTFMAVRLIKQSTKRHQTLRLMTLMSRVNMTSVTVKDSSAKAHYQYINYKGPFYRQSAEKKILNTEFGD